MAAANAEAALARQRKGIDTSGPEVAKKGDTDKVEILMSQKDGPVTKGVPWGESRAELKDVKGLVCSVEGCYYVCEYETCAI